MTWAKLWKRYIQRDSAPTTLPSPYAPWPCEARPETVEEQWNRLLTRGEGFPRPPSVPREFLQ